jgi:hypothetical protein
MKKLGRFEQTKMLEDRLAGEAERLHAEADALPPGLQREELLRKAGQIDVAAHITDWLNSPGLRPPK